MLKEIIIALQSYYKAHLFIKKYKLWKWIIVPGIVYAVLFFVSVYFFGKTASHVIDSVTYRTGLKEWLTKNNSGFIGFLFTLASVMFWLLQMLLYFSWFKYIWLIIGSPVFSYLSEKTYSIVQQKEFVFNTKQFLKDIKRGIYIALRNSLWQTIYMVSILLLSLIPVAGWLTPLLALLVECYYYGFSMLDYTSERNKLTASESIYFIGHHKGLAIGNGLAFYLMQCVPLIGWVLAPAYAVVAATLSLNYYNEPVQA